MFTDLLESRRARRRRSRVAVVSLAAHAVAITFASAATRHAPLRPLKPDERLITYVAPPPTHPPTRISTSTTGGRGRPTPTSPTSAPPTIPNFHPVTIDPVDPTTLPVVDDGPGPWRADSASAHGATGASGAVPVDGIYKVVERAAAALPGAPTARYPEALRQASIEGSVVLRFVVDSAGRVEPGTVVTVSASQPLFADAARRALVQTRFAPAEVGGRRVRQLVEQTYAFTLDR